MRPGLPRPPPAALGKSLVRFQVLQRPPWHNRVLRRALQASLMQPCHGGNFLASVDSNVIYTADTQEYIETVWMKGIIPPLEVHSSSSQSALAAIAGRHVYEMALAPWASNSQHELLRVQMLP